MPLGIGLPLPPAHPGWAAARRHSPRRGGAAGGPGYPGTPPAGRLPRGGAAAQPPPGGAGYPGRRRAPCTGHVRGGYPRRLPARAGRLPGKTGRFPGRTARLAGRLPCGVATPAAYTACAGAATGRAGAGRRAAPGRRGGTATPGRALPPAATPGAAGGAMQRAVTGMRRHHGVGGYQNRACRAKTPRARLSRAYKEALFPGPPRGYFLDKTS